MTIFYAIFCAIVIGIALVLQLGIFIVYQLQKLNMKNAELIAVVQAATSKLENAPVPPAPASDTADAGVVDAVNGLIAASDAYLSKVGAGGAPDAPPAGGGTEVVVDPNL